MKHAEIWNKIRESVSEKTYESLRRLDAMYDGEAIARWMANLWDPEHGAFYITTTAHDYEPYRPDIESTYQILYWLQGHGAMKNSNDLPDQIKEKIIAFAQSMQSERDGYFYHEQWPKSTDLLQTDRYGRDLAWACDIISRHTVTDAEGKPMRRYPKFCTPSGLKCEKHYGTDERCLFPKTAVRKADATLSEHPDYSSHEAFSRWLSAYCHNVKNDSGMSHKLNALKEEIFANGCGALVVDFLERAADEVYAEQTAAGDRPSGLWQRKADYKFTLSIQKYMPFFNNPECGRALKYPKEIVQSCINFIVDSPADGKYAMNDIMNQCNTFGHVFTNIRRFHSEPDRLIGELQAMISERAHEMIDSVALKLDSFRLPSGLFSFSTNKVSPITMYGVPASHGLCEADVNGMILCCVARRNIFTSLGLPIVPLCDESDGEMFVDIITNKKPVVKKAPIVYKGQNFECEPLSVECGHFDMRVSDECDIRIAPDPKDEENKAVYFKGKRVSGLHESDYLRHRAFHTGGRCNVCEFKLLALSIPTDAPLLVRYDECFLLHIANDDGYLKVNAVSDPYGNGDSEVVYVGEKIPTTEWCKIRIEEHDPELGEREPTTKIYINDKFAAETRIFPFSHKENIIYNNRFGYVTFHPLSYETTQIMVDDIYCCREELDYTKENTDE